MMSKHLLSLDSVKMFLSDLGKLSCTAKENFLALSIQQSFNMSIPFLVSCFS